MSRSSKIHLRVCKHNRKRATYRTACGIRMLKNCKIRYTFFDECITCEKCLRKF